MKFIKTNKKINGLEIKIRHPETGEFLTAKTVIDTTKETPMAVKYFNRMLVTGDLQKYKKELNNDIS